MFSVQCEELRTNFLTLFLVVTMRFACWFLWRAYYIEDLKWRLHFQFGVAFWRVVLREVYFEGPNRVWRASKTFNLEHRLVHLVCAIRAGLHHGSWNRIMHGRWPSPMVWFLKKSIYKAFGPLTRCKLKVNQEEWPCTKSECAGFLNICPKRTILNKKIKLIIFLSSLVFIFSSQKNISFKPYYNIISLPWALPFLLEHLFCHSHRKTRWTMWVDNVDLEIYLLGTSNSMVTLTFFSLGVNQSGLGTRSTTNHKFYRALGRFHGPWCKQP